MGVAPSARPVMWAAVVVWGGRDGLARCEPPALAKPNRLCMVALHLSIKSVAGGNLSSSWACAMASVGDIASRCDPHRRGWVTPLVS